MNRQLAAVVSVCLLSGACGESPGDLTGTDIRASRESVPSPSATALRTLSLYQVSAGHDHTCGVTTDNLAFCWGDNSTGQLGDGTTAAHPTPVAVTGGLHFHQLSAGFGTTCGVTTEHRAYCWGYNATGQLGDGSSTQRVTPVLVAGGHQFSQVETSFEHACGVGYPSHRAFCWGSNSDGELGDNTRIARLTPVAVAGNLLMRQVSAGYNHSCGVTTNNDAYCWGYNLYGQIGDSTLVRRRLRPIRVAGAHQFRLVDAGAYHTCAVTTGDQAFCWGSGKQGQLGNGKNFIRSSPKAVAGGLYFTRVSGGLFHTCGETRSKQAYCWGNNANGQLGNGTTTTHLSPVSVVGGLSFAQLSVGAFHTCAKTPAAVAYCWGWDAFGQLGDGTNTSSSQPIPVSGGT